MEYSNIEVFLVELTNIECWIDKLKDQVVVGCHFNSYDIKVLEHTTIFRSSRSTFAPPVFLDLAHTRAAITVHVVPVVALKHAEVESIAALLNALARRPLDHALGIARQTPPPSEVLTEVARGTVLVRAAIASLARGVAARTDARCASGSVLGARTVQVQVRQL